MPFLLGSSRAMSLQGLRHPASAFAAAKAPRTRRNRPLSTVASSSSSPPPPPSTQSAASASRALKLVDDAMELLHRELFVSEAISRATGEPLEDERDVVARVVEELSLTKKKNKEKGRASEKDGFIGGFGEGSATSSNSDSQQEEGRQLDEAFLVALGVAAASADAAAAAAASAAPDDENNNKTKQVARRLQLLREATVARASASLPSELRALDLAARADSAAERRAIIREALVGGRRSRSEAKGDDGDVIDVDVDDEKTKKTPRVPFVSPASFYSACCQFVDDMESRQIVPDSRLLARVVLCRDDALALQRDNDDDGDGNKGESAFADRPEEDAGLREAQRAHGAMLHKGAAELAGALVSCGSRDQRRELLRGVMSRGDVLAWKVGDGGQKDKDDDSSIPSLAAARAAPRPGRLLAAIYATRDALAERGDSRRAEALDKARADAASVLEEVAYS